MGSTSRPARTIGSLVATLAVAIGACSPAQPLGTATAGVRRAPRPRRLRRPRRRRAPPATTAPSAPPRNPGRLRRGRGLCARVRPRHLRRGGRPSLLPDGRRRVVRLRWRRARRGRGPDETKDIMGIKATVVRDRVFERCEVIEDTLDWYGQDAAGQRLVPRASRRPSTRTARSRRPRGSWETGVDGALPGIVMLAEPQAGDIYRQEFLQGEAEDIGEVTAVTGSVSVPAGSWSGSDVLVTEEWTPLEPDVRERKIYARGFGVVRIKTIQGGNEQTTLTERRPPGRRRRRRQARCLPARLNAVVRRGLLPSPQRPDPVYALRPPGPVDGGAEGRQMPRIVRGALLQASWTGDKESMIQKHEEAAHEAAKQGAQVMLFQELFYGPYFCQVQDPQYYSLHGADPGRPDDEADAGPRQADRHGPRRADVRGGRPGLGHLLQHRRRDRRRRQVPRQVPQDPHPARQGLLGEVLLPAREHGLPGLRDRGRQGRRVHLLRPPLPRGRPRARPERRRDGVHPVGDVTRPVASTCGASSRSATRSRTATSSGRSTASASRRTSATTTSTGRATSSTRAASSSASVGSPYDEELIVRDMDLDVVSEVRQTWQFYRDRRPDAYGDLVRP